MSSTPTAEERAEQRFPSHISVAECLAYNPGVELAPNRLAREVYRACIREEVEPLEAENVKLRALVQGLVDALEGTKSNTGWWRSHPSEEWIADAIADAASQGFTPTNTTDK